MAYRKLRQNIMAANGETYTLAVAVIRTTGPDGTPRHIELIPHDEPIDIVNPANRQMLTVYVPKYMMKTQPKAEEPS